MSGWRKFNYEIVSDYTFGKLVGAEYKDKS